MENLALLNKYLEFVGLAVMVGKKNAKNQLVDWLDTLTADEEASLMSQINKMKGK